MNIIDNKFKLNTNPKLGYYTVGDKVFYSKPMALIESTKTGDFPHWNFSNDVFDKVKWEEECPVELGELYRLRAQQLREKYDYIRMEFSGGGDSAVALYSFVKNGIHLDEVTFRYPKRGEKDVTDDPFNYKPENTLSEYKFAAQPALQWLAIHAPKTKIVIHDYTDHMITADYDETWVFKSKEYFQPGHTFKHDPLGMKDHRLLADSGKNICVLYGVDKPKICIKDRKWYLYFMDAMANHSNSITEEYDNINIEYFFWTPDLPEIIHKQARLVVDWFNMPMNKHLQYICRWPNHSMTQRSTYENLIKPLIYPDYDPTTFQTNKPSNSFYNEMDYWFYTNFQDTDQYRKWKAGLQLLVDSIDPKFFNYELGKPVGFVGFLTPFYCLGDANFVDSGINIHNRF